MSKLRTGIGTKISFFAFQDIITSVTGILILVTLILTLYMDQAPPVTTVQDQAKQELKTLRDELFKITQSERQRQTVINQLATAPAPEKLREEIRELQAHVVTQSNDLRGLLLQLDERDRQAARRAEELGLGDLKEKAGKLEKEIKEAQQTNDAMVAEQKTTERSATEFKEKVDKATTEHKLWLIPDSTPASKEPVLLTVASNQVTCERFNQPASRKVIPARQVDAGLGQALAQWNSARDYLVFYVRPSGIDLFRRCLDLARRQNFQIGYDAVEEQRQIMFSAPSSP
jgi:hypothetical protein